MAEEKKEEKLTLSKGTLTLNISKSDIGAAKPREGGVKVEVRGRLKREVKSEDTHEQELNPQAEEINRRLKQVILEAEKNKLETSSENEILEKARAQVEAELNAELAEKKKREAEIAAAAETGATREHAAKDGKGEARADKKRSHDDEENFNKDKKSRFKEKEETTFRKTNVSLSIADVIPSEEDDEVEETPNVFQRRHIGTPKRHKEKAKKGAPFVAPQVSHEKVIHEVTLPETITVKDLAARMAESAANVVKALMKMGMMVTINQVIDADTAELVVEELGHKTKRITDAEIEKELLNIVPDTDVELKPRAPVVTVMGHVDHGKTSLLDALRSSDVAEKEAGGITQHIGAYQVKTSQGSKITFIDTPGHEAFSAMRARGAQVTDIVVLVVAADDGIMPQTIEAISHAKASGVPIVVAINKIDLPQANPARIKTDLLQHEVVLEEMGGEVLSVEISAKKRINLEKLEEAILLQADMLNLKANPRARARGTVVEARIDKGRGAFLTALIQNGSLEVGDIFVSGKQWGRVRSLVDYKGASAKIVGPSEPIGVVGLQSGVPESGDDFYVVPDEATAKKIATMRTQAEFEKNNVKSASTVAQLFEDIKAGTRAKLPIIIKVDVQGSAEALVSSLEKAGNDKVSAQVIHTAVGGINETDINLAKTSGALVIGFNVRASSSAAALAKQHGIDIRYYSIIYEAVDDVKKLLSGMLPPELKENFIGYAEIRQVFGVGKGVKAAGCMVTKGVIKRGCKCRILRDDIVIATVDLAQLKRFKDDVKEVKESLECGLSFENYNDIKEGDVVECFEIEQIAATL